MTEQRDLEGQRMKPGYRLRWVDLKEAIGACVLCFLVLLWLSHSFLGSLIGLIFP